MSIDIQLVSPGNGPVLDRVADGVFDHALNPRWTAAFQSDARHHMFVALDHGVVVGMISAVDYVHPDKAPQLWINEVGVAPSHQRRGIARRLLDTMLAHGRALGCTEAWLGTEETNDAANALYRAATGKAEPFVLYSWELQSAHPGEDDAT